MNRRTALAGAGFALSSALVGCLGGTPSSTPNPGGKNYTAPSDVDVIDEPEPMPEPPESPTLESARSFVRTYEEHRIHNELLGMNVSEPHEGHVGIAGDRDAVELEVEPATVATIRERDGGYYLVSSCGGEAEYWCSYDRDRSSTTNRSCGHSSRRNADSVVHLVAPETHVRVPYDWYRCTGPDEPYAAADEAENVSTSDPGSGAQLQFYNFDEDEREVEVTIRDVDGPSPTDVYAATAGAMPYLTVLSDVARKRGTYEIEAAVDGDRPETFEWELTEEDAPSWTGRSVFVTPAGECWAETIGADGDPAFSATSCRSVADGGGTDGDGENQGGAAE